ncbi:hypothetical protein CRENBAI_007072 [Crenichthys baileyi]|uniref:Murine leukemia virus integrase C-terminal domain-containing protein n=1 Tax=Crenichthys baileyi TaxID=28760 RepID=A0AAV9RBD5_9TELE
MYYLRTAASSLHSFVPGGWILVREFKRKHWSTRWRGPYEILLITLTTIKASPNHDTDIEHVLSPNDMKALHTAAPRKADEDTFTQCKLTTQPPSKHPCRSLPSTTQRAKTGHQDGTN